MSDLDGDWYDIEGQPVSREAAERLLADHQARRIGWTEIGPYVVSTVHLVLDHNYGEGPPLIFETLALVSPDEDDYCRRTPTKEAALAMHDQVVSIIRDAWVAQETVDKDLLERMLNR